MTNDTTVGGGRQVQKVLPLSVSELREYGVDVYYHKQGEVYAEMTYLAVPPKPGKGKKEPLHEEKQQGDIRRAMKRLRGMIRANFGQDGEKEAHITLTYQGVMTDTEKLQKDLENWVRALRNAYKTHHFEYIAVMEPHATGGWHIHLLLKSDQPLWHSNGVEGLSFNKTRELWRRVIKGGGNTNHERLPDDVEDIGKYFVMYFTTAIPETLELDGDRAAIKAASKAAIKGSRLKFYPAGFRFYRASMGIVRPKPVKVSVDKAIGGYAITDTQAYAVTEGEDESNRKQYIQTFEMKTAP